MQVFENEHQSTLNTFLCIWHTLCLYVCNYILVNMKNFILLLVSMLLPLGSFAQIKESTSHERALTLSEAIALARIQSVDAAVALNELKTAYWEYRTFRANLLPEISFYLQDLALLKVKIWQCVLPNTL